MPLWTKRTNSTSQDDSTAIEAPDEHSRLLPNRVDSGTIDSRVLGLEDVSPYKDTGVKVAWIITIIFTILTALWWFILFISIFLTFSHLHSPGSVFFGFSYTSIALATLAFHLIFFAAPAKFIRILSAVMTGFLVIDMIITLAAGEIRYEEDIVGIVSIVWALLMVLWTILIDVVVKHGKATIEEEMIGHVEARRTWSERLEVGTSGVVIVTVLACVLLVTITLIIRTVDTGVAPPGKRYLVSSGSYRIHLHCQGNVTDSKGNKLPTVLLEGGEDPVEDGLWQLAEETVRNGSISRFCFLDRPGYAWSDAAPSPMSAGMEVMAINEVLAKAGERGPWVIVSAGIGTIYSRIFSAQHGKDVRGLVLIDPLHEDSLGDVGSGLRRFLLFLRGIISPLGLDRVPGAIFKGRSSTDRIWGTSYRQSSKLVFSRLQESLAATTFTKREAKSSRTTQRQNTPLTIITSGNKLKKDSKWESAQRDLSKLTANLQHWDIVDGAPHRIWDTEDGRQMIAKRMEQMVNL